MTGWADVCGAVSAELARAARPADPSLAGAASSARDGEIPATHDTAQPAQDWSTPECTDQRSALRDDSPFPRTLTKTLVFGGCGSPGLRARSFLPSPTASLHQCHMGRSVRV